MKALYQDTGARCSNEIVVCEPLLANDEHCETHFHEEIEILLTLAPGIHRAVGDTFASMQPGDLVVIGPHLPHRFFSKHNNNTTTGIHEGGQSFNNSTLSKIKTQAHAISIKFNPANLGSWLQFTDVRQLQTFFRNSCYGFEVQGRTRQIVTEKLSSLMESQGLQRLILLLDILNDLSSNIQDLTQIASPGCSLEASAPVHHRLQRLTRFIKKNLSEPLYLKDVAQHVGMSPVSLSRYLRAHLKKTFPTYLNELRIARVCRLLRETDGTVSEIAAYCGFESMANFERQFRKFHHCSPKAYRRRFQSTINMPQAKTSDQSVTTSNSSVHRPKLKHPLNGSQPRQSSFTIVPTKRVYAA